MAFYCQNMLEIALILIEYDPVYEEMAYRILEHFVWIAYAMDRIGAHHDELWDEEDGFFYDVLRLPNGQAIRLKVRSMVGLLPVCASSVFRPQQLAKVPGLKDRLRRFADRHPSLSVTLASAQAGVAGGPRLLSVVD